MKKILAFAVVLSFGITYASAQTATTAVATEQATPIIKVTDVNGKGVNCTSTGKSGSCCSKAGSASTSTAEAPMNDIGTEQNGTAVKAEGEHCKSASYSVSAAKPEPAKVDETPEK